MPETIAPEDDLNPPAEARVIINGEPIDGGGGLFVGTLSDAIDYVHALDAAHQAEVSIVTDGRIYDPKEV